MTLTGHNQGRSIPLICLLLHENEPHRTSATHPLIQHCLPDTRVFIWQRSKPDQLLLALLKDPDFSPYLIFPGERLEEKSRIITTLPDDTRRPLLVIPDGTWKEVRKIVRKSPYLESLPVLSLNPAHKTRYRLRRNPDAGHICTSEVVAQLMAPFDNAISEQLNEALEQFQIDYYAR